MSHTTNKTAIDALKHAADVIELFDDATMKADYMLDAGECAGIIRALAESPDYAALAPTVQEAEQGEAAATSGGESVAYIPQQNLEVLLSGASPVSVLAYSPDCMRAGDAALYLAPQSLPAVAPEQSVREAFTYTVDGVVMSPLEYISQLHEVLAAAAPQSLPAASDASAMQLCRDLLELWDSWQDQDVEEAEKLRIELAIRALISKETV